MPSFRAMAREPAVGDNRSEYGCLAVVDDDGGPALRTFSSGRPRTGRRLAAARGSSTGRHELVDSDVLGAEVQMPVHKAVQMAMGGRERAVALYDWDARARRAHGLDTTAAGGNLLFRRGDLLEVNPDVFAMDDGGSSARGWMAGACYGTSGIFPCEYVELVGDEHLEDLEGVSMRDALMRDITREKYVAHMLHEFYERRHNLLALPVMLIASLCSFFSFLSTGDNGFSRWFISWSPVLVGWMAAAAAVMQGLQQALGYNYRSECFANAARAYALIETQLDRVHRTLVLDGVATGGTDSLLGSSSIALTDTEREIRENARQALELVEEEILDLRKTMRYLPPSDIVAELHAKLHEAAEIPGFGAVFTTTTDVEALRTAMGGESDETA
eukprot:COSAG06_NODE_13332_length_1267_cov_1.660103_1_plen_386_part_10